MSSLKFRLIKIFFIKCYSVGFTSSAVGQKLRVITARIKKYKPIIKKNEKKHDKIVLLGTSESDTIEALISKTLID